ncbi:MAG: HEPN domain-containing protein [Patescibacteria group bacterium]
MPNNHSVWFEKAKDNLRWAEDNLKAGNYPLVCYLSQQAVELLLKGYIYKQDKIPSKTHSLVILAKNAEEVGLKISDIIKDLAILSEYYFQSRYPDSLNKDLNNQGVAKRAVEKTERIFKAVL